MLRANLQRMSGSCAALALSIAALAQPYEYAAIWIPPVNDNWGYPSSINARGELAGSGTFDGLHHAARWIGTDRMLDLGALPGGISRSDSVAINDFGWVAGWSDNATSSYVAVMWRQGEIIDLGSLGGDISQATDINNRGDIVGWADRPVGSDMIRAAFLFIDGELKQLPNPYGDDLRSSAVAINEYRDIVGWIDTGPFPNPRVDVLWRDNMVIELPSLPFGLGVSVADINELGEVTGSAKDRRTDEHAFLWDGEVILDIHGLGHESLPQAINNATEIVGYSRLTSDPYNSTLAPFRWDYDDRMIDLNTRTPPLLDLKLTMAHDINDHGQIVAIGNLGAGARLLSRVHPTLALSIVDGRLVAGERNQLLVEGGAPGDKVHFAYAYAGGGTAIPGCALHTNALQLTLPKVAGTAITDASGNARLVRMISSDQRGQTYVLQAFIPSACAVSNLLVEEVH